jgi:hypothetical protein
MSFDVEVRLALFPGSGLELSPFRPDLALRPTRKHLHALAKATSLALTRAAGEEALRQVEAAVVQKRLDEIRRDWAAG